VKVSPPLSLMARPGDGSIRTRCIALLVAARHCGAPLEELHRKLADEGAVPRFVGARLGTVRGADGRDIDVEVTFETAPSCCSMQS
jgi:catalase